MRRSLPGVDVALSAAVDRVRELYQRIPEGRRPDVTGERWADLEREIDRACGAGDADAALRAIAAWESHAEGVLGWLAELRPLTLEDGSSDG